MENNHCPRLSDSIGTAECRPNRPARPMGPWACPAACVIMPRPHTSRTFPSMNRLAALAALLILGGCQTFTQQAPESGPPVEDAAPEAAASEVTEYGSFTRQSLYALLVAELAGQRNRFDIALGNYVQQAHATQDAGVAERGFRIAEYLGADQAALDTSLIWARNAPENLDAQRAAAVQLARAGRYEESMEFMERSCRARATRTSTSSPCRLRKPIRTPAPACCRASTSCWPGTRTIRSCPLARPYFCNRTIAARKRSPCCRSSRPSSGRSPPSCSRRACYRACNAATRPSHCWRKACGSIPRTSACA